MCEDSEVICIGTFNDGLTTILKLPSTIGNMVCVIMKFMVR